MENLFKIHGFGSHYRSTECGPVNSRVMKESWGNTFMEAKGEPWGRELMEQKPERGLTFEM